MLSRLSSLFSSAPQSEKTRFETVSLFEPLRAALQKLRNKEAQLRALVPQETPAETDNDSVVVADSSSQTALSAHPANQEITPTKEEQQLAAIKAKHEVVAALLTQIDEMINQFNAPTDQSGHIEAGGDMQRLVDGLNSAVNATKQIHYGALMEHRNRYRQTVDDFLRVGLPAATFSALLASPVPFGLGTLMVAGAGLAGNTAADAAGTDDSKTETMQILDALTKVLDQLKGEMNPSELASIDIHSFELPSPSRF